MTFLETKIERIYHRWTNITKNTKNIYTGRKKAILEMQEGMESDSKGKCVVKLKCVKNKNGWRAGQRDGQTGDKVNTEKC